MPELGLELVRDVDRERFRSRLPRWDPRLWGDAEFSKNTRPGNRLLKLGLAWGRERVKARKLQQESVTPSGDVAPVSRFTGKEEDIEVGLQYFGKRYLSPYLGRWISPDPLAIHSPGSADLNLYAYVSGAVLKATDPLGLETDANGVRVGSTRVERIDSVEVTPEGEKAAVYKTIETSTAAKSIAVPASGMHSISGLNVDEHGVLDTETPEREGIPLEPAPDGLEEGLANVILQKITGQDLLEAATDKPPPGWKPLRPFPNGNDTLGRVMVEGFMLGLGSVGPAPPRLVLEYPKLRATFSTATLSEARANTTGFIFRGIHAEHPAIEAARQGRVVPGNLRRQIDDIWQFAEAQNLNGGAADSPLTSWTHDFDIALQHMNKNGPGGIMLRLPQGAPGPNASWSWVWSPDAWGESEVFLRGLRSGATVIQQ